MVGVPYNIPIDKVYAVVELKVDKGVPYSTVAPTCWLQDVLVEEDDGKLLKYGQCMWPKDETKLNDYLERRKKPSSSKKEWTTYKVKVLKLCRSLRDAKDSAVIAQHQSDLSESDAGLPLKRKRKLIDRFTAGKEQFVSSEDESGNSSVSSDSDDRPLKKLKIGSCPAPTRVNCIEDSDDENGQQITSPVSSSKELEVLVTPKQTGELSASTLAVSAAQNEHRMIINDDDGIDIQHLKGAQPTGLSTPRNNSPPANGKPCESGVVDKGRDTEDKENNSPESFVEKPSSSKSAFGNKTSSTGQSASFNQLSSPLAVPLNTDTREQPLSTLRMNCNSRKGLFSSPFSKLNISSGDLLNTALLREFTIINAKLQRIENKVDKLMASSCPDLELSSLNKDNQDSNGIPSLPLDTEEDETAWDNFIADGVNAATAINFLSDYGSQDCRETAFGIMRKLYSNKLATTYNFKGINRANVATKKRGFVNSKSYTIVQAAAKKHIERVGKTNTRIVYELSAITEAISDWLKDAPKRHKSELDKANKDNNI